MDPSLILPIVQAIIAAAPTIIEGVEKAKTFVTALFTSGLISADQQNALHMHVDSLGALAATGVIPAAFRVRPDPVV